MSDGSGNNSANIVFAGFLILGIFSLVFAILFESQILAFIGLGLTFWGTLFLTLKPRKYVRSSLLSSMAIPSYLTMDRFLKHLECNGPCYYIPPYPKDVYLPLHLKGLTDAVAFIPSGNDNRIPEKEELAAGKFLVQDPEGVLLTPPGAGLLTKIEDELKTEFTSMQLTQVFETLPRALSENLNLAKAMEIDLQENQIHLKLVDSSNKTLYAEENNLLSLRLLGCPIVSAVACAVAKSSGKPVIIEKQEASSNGSEIDVWYRTVDGVI